MKYLFIGLWNIYSKKWNEVFKNYAGGRMYPSERLTVSSWGKTKYELHQRVRSEDTARGNKRQYRHFCISSSYYEGLQGGRISNWLCKSIELFVNDRRAQGCIFNSLSKCTSLNDIVKHDFWSTTNSMLSKSRTVLSKCNTPCVAGRQIIS